MQPLREFAKLQKLQDSGCSVFGYMDVNNKWVLVLFRIVPMRLHRVIESK